MRKTHVNRITRVAFGLMLLMIIALSLLLIQVFKVDGKSNKQVFAASDIGTASCNHDHEHDYAQYDIPDGYEGPLYIEDFWEGGIQHLALPTINTTCEGFSNHGPGRENGYSTNFLTTGCNSYRSTGYRYGSNFLPYFINTAGFTSDQIAEIERQANLWNQAVMHDGTGQIVTVERRANTNNVSGRPVCQIIRVSDSGAGAFFGSASAPRIEIYNNSNGDTTVHEMGHFLGLRDTDTLSGVTSGTHKTLMGYSRGNSTTAAINIAIKYQDIQGIAIANSAHTHNFMRYVANGSNRTYICFYCDAYSNSTTEVISGSAAMATASGCTHTYQQMVSHGDRHWHKCTKCYEVIETPFKVKGLTSTTLEVIGVVGTLSGFVTIPATIGGNNVTAIGYSAFANQTQLSQISIPASVTSIGDGAFKNCSNLTSVSPIPNIQSIGAEAFYGCGSLSNISIPAGLTSIGQKAFAGCGSLNISVAASNPNYSSAGNIFYNKNKTVLYSAGKVASEVTIPSSVTEISPHAFEGNPHLFKIYFPNTIILGAYAFADCEALNSAYFSSYNTPSMGVNSFAGDEITVYVPYDAQNAYRTAFAGYPLTIDSVHSQVQFISNGTTLKTIDVPYGSTKNNIFTPEQNGYTFCGWFDNPALGGSPYQNGGKWEITENLNLYAKWEAKNYTVTLNANDGIYNGVTSYPVAFHTSFSIPSSPLPYKPPTKEGYTFDGWYDSLTGGTRYITVSGQSVNLWDKTADTTLYARWAIESYEIKIDVDGNFVWLGATGLSNVPCSIPYGTLISGINLVPTFKATEQGYKEGRNFDHFEYENKQINWERVTDLGDNGKVVVIFPKWTLEKHTIYFDMQMTGSILPLQNVEWGSPITLPSIIRTGYNFTGWYTSGGIKIEWNSMPDLTPKTAQNTFLEAQTNGSIQLLARYSVIQYNIAYSLDGGVNASANPASYNITTVKTFLSPTKTGHNFMGWYTDSEKINPISGLNYTTGHKTLYAKWEKMKYSITYSNVVFDTVPSLNLKGIALVYIGSFNNQQLPPTVFEYGNTVFIGNVIATYYMNSYNTGYVEDTLIFDGWYKEANFQNRAYTIAENRNVTVYGKWRYEKKYTRAGERKYTDADKNSQPFDLIHSLKKEYLTALGISKITVSISMEIKEVNAGTQLIYLCSASQTLYPFEVTHGGNSINKNYSTYTFDKTVSLNDFSDDALYLKYSASGSLGDDWCNRNVSVTVKSA